MLRLERYAYSRSATMGRLTASDPNFERSIFETIEPPWKGNRIDISCIPEGLYRCSPVHSPKFGHTYQIENVVGRTHILFHAGNHAKDTSGCVCVGYSESDMRYEIRNSSKALGQLLSGLGGRPTKLLITQYRPGF